MEVLRPVCAVKAIILMVVTAILFRCVTAINHTVGGDSGWDTSSNILAWTAATTFRVGDYVVFKYLPLHDVLEVNRTDFSNCRTVNPISTHSDGETVIHLERPGTRYFICGRLRHCNLGLKLRVQVLQRVSNDNNSTDGGHNQEQGRRPRPPIRSPPPLHPTPPPPQQHFSPPQHPSPPPQHPSPPPPQNPFSPPQHPSPPPPLHPSPSLPFEPPPFQDIKRRPYPCICSGVGEIMPGGLIKWLPVFLISASLSCSFLKFHPSI